MSTQYLNGIKTKFMALATVVGLGFATSASGATLATGFINGGYGLETSPMGSTFFAFGTLGGSFFPSEIPTGDAIYTSTATLTLGQSSPVTASASETGTTADLAELFALGTTLVDVVANLSDMALPLPGGVGTFHYNFDNVLVAQPLLPTDPISATVEYVLFFETNKPVGPLVDVALANLFTELGVNLPGLDTFNFPNDGAGEFNLEVTLDVAPVPLPAGGLLLLTGLGLIAAKRRKQTP